MGLSICWVFDFMGLFGGFAGFPWSLGGWGTLAFFINIGSASLGFRRLVSGGVSLAVSWRGSVLY